MYPEMGALNDITVVERSSTVAGAYAGRVLASLGAKVVLLEPTGGHRLRHRRPQPEGAAVSSIFAYVAAGKQGCSWDPESPDASSRLRSFLAQADIYIDDFPPTDRRQHRVDSSNLRAAFPGMTYVSIRPFGLAGPKAHWPGEEVTLFHAAGEGYLLPNGLAFEDDSAAPPLKIHGHFAEYQAGLFGALAAVSQLYSGSGDVVDISVQDAAVSVGTFSVQRFEDGARETRRTRSFRYGGVLECRNGFIELLTLEERQWDALVRLLGEPSWCYEARFADNVGRGRHGAEINRHLKAWARGQDADEIVCRAQRLGVPVAKYRSPKEVLNGKHEQERNLFQHLSLPGYGVVPILRSPFHFNGKAIDLASGVPRLADRDAPSCLQTHASAKKDDRSGRA